MLSIRIVATGTLAAAVLGAAIAGAAAQNATQSAGSPLPLLQFFQHKSKAKPLAHSRRAARFERKTVAKRRIVRRAIAVPHKAVVAAARPVPEAAAADALPENMWPAAGTVSPGVTGTLASPQPGPPVSTESVVETDPDEIVAGSHTVQLAPPDRTDAIDLAADNHQQPATEQTPTTAAPPQAAAPEPAAHAFIARAAVEKPETPSPVGSASWIAQVLAALGGAVTAGVVAWFLIRPAPERTYG